MVRLSTTYDKVKDEDGNEKSMKVFVLRGDEAYAKTTTSLVSYSGYNDDVIDNYTIDVNLEVLRGVGASHIYLYLDDVVVSSYNTNTNTSQFTHNDLALSYGVEHRLYARYEGNGQCMSSRSKTEIVEYDIPSKFATDMTITGDTQYEVGDDVDLTVALEIGGSSTASGTRNCDINVRVDGNLIEPPLNTGNTNTANLHLENLTEGMHTLDFDVARASTINPASVSVSVAVGYNVEIIEYPTVFFNEGTDSIKVKVTDYWNNPIVGETVTFMSFDSGTTDSDGIATVQNDGAWITTGDYSAECLGSLSEPIHVDVVNVNNILIDYDDGITNYGGVEPITVTVANNQLANIPVTMSGGITGTYYTNEYGKVTVNYNGRGAGQVGITASVFNNTKSLTVTDLLYWLNPKIPNPNTGYSVVQGELVRTNTAYVLKTQNYIGYILFGDTVNHQNVYPMNLMFRYKGNTSITINLQVIINNCQSAVPDLELSKNDVITCEWDGSNNRIIISKNGTELPTMQMSAGGIINSLWIQTQTGIESQISIDELRIERL